MTSCLQYATCTRKATTKYSKISIDVLRKKGVRGILIELKQKV